MGLLVAEAAVATLGLVLTPFVVYRLFFLIPSLFLLGRKRQPTRAFPSKSFAIIVPAHNEQLLIGQLIDSIRAQDYPAGNIEILVLADNCTDRTAEIARAKGAVVHERFDAELRGKPHALHWLVKRLDLGRHDAYVVIDADTTLHPGFIAAMNRHLGEGHEVLQGYFGVRNPDENWLTRLSILPGILKFKLHYPAKNLFGLSCPLAGNGMCFARSIFETYGWNAFSLTENWEYYAMLCLEGRRVVSADDAIIYSQVARSFRQGTTQRLRWLKGRIETLARYGMPLLRRGVTERNWDRIDALLELLQPSNSMLFLWSLIFAAGAVAVNGLGSTSAVWPVWGVGVLGGQVALYVTGLIVQRAPTRTWLALVMVPPYLVWKFAVSVYGIADLRHRDWVKTERHKDDDGVSR